MTNDQRLCESGDLDNYDEMDMSQRVHAMRTAREAGRMSKTAYPPFDEGHPLRESWISGRLEADPAFVAKSTRGMSNIDAALALAADTPNAD